MTVVRPDSLAVQHVEDLPDDLRPGLSVIVPVYRSALLLEALVERLHPVLEEIAPNGFELILVNDGSPDDSWAVVSELAARHDWVHGIDLMRNYGQHNALLVGLRAARHEIAVTMDDDLQHPPEEIPKLLATLGEGYDVVYGIAHALPHSPLRNLLSRGTKAAMAQAMGVHNIRDISAFRAFRTHLRVASARYSGPTLILDVLLSWGTTRFGTVEVRHDPRREGVSGYTLGKLFNHAMLILTGFSTKPLRAASLIGFAFTLLGVLVLAYVIGVYLTSRSVPGFPFLASLISIFGGVQLFALGIIGEYLGRVFDRSLDRPPYAVRAVVGQSGRDESEEPSASMRSSSL